MLTYADVYMYIYNAAAAGAVYVNECVSICGDSRRSVDELCDDGNKYPGDG